MWTKFGFIRMMGDVAARCSCKTCHRDTIEFLRENKHLQLQASKAASQCSSTTKRSFTVKSYHQIHSAGYKHRITGYLKCIFDASYCRSCIKLRVVSVSVGLTHTPTICSYLLNLPH